MRSQYIQHVQPDSIYLFLARCRSTHQSYSSVPAARSNSDKMNGLTSQHTASELCFKNYWNLPTILTMRYYKNSGVKTYQLLKSMCLLYPLCIQVVWRPIKNIILLLVSYITHRWNGKFISVTTIFQTYFIKCSQRKDLTAEKCEYYRKEIIGFFAHFQARIFCLILFTSSIDHPL